MVPTTAPPGARIYSSPLRYVQGPGALDQVGRFAALGHSRAALLLDSFIADEIEPRLVRSLEAGGLAIDTAAGAIRISFGYETTETEIDAISAALIRLLERAEAGSTGRVAA